MRKHVNPKSGIAVSFFALVIGILFIPGQMTQNSVLLGFPLRFISIYSSSFDNLAAGNMPISTFKINVLGLVGNLVIYFFLYKFASEIGSHIQTISLRFNKKE